MEGGTNEPPASGKGAKRKFILRVQTFLAILTVHTVVSFGAGIVGLRTESGSAVSGADRGYLGRNLLQISNENRTISSILNANCTEPAIDDFPPDLFSDSQRRNGAVVLHAVLAIYLLLFVAIVCDDYFVPSIKRITKALHISKDVAGATFMAAATSSPELFINSVGTFVTEGDLGIGTIVGSGVFNILAVPACCGLIAGKSIPMDWWPLTRDCIAYGVAVIILILTMFDGLISWAEALILVGSYVVYIVIMFYNSEIESWAKRCRNNNEREETRLLIEEAHKNPGIMGISYNSSNEYDTDSSDEEEKGERGHVWPKNGGKLAKFWWIFKWPVSTILRFTIPDCRKFSQQHLYPITFLMCMFYIGSCSYLIAWMITVIGDAARIPDSVMGLTFLAGGTSLPEAISSVIVTSQGFGSMGLSNSIGSNTFDILLCLGFPWLIKSVFFPTVPGEHFVIINSKGMEYSAITLLSTLLILYVSFVWNQFRLNRKVGLVCLIIY
ncbi:hypothetical protein J437_LFUL012445, partial [Ladona fulva]